MHPTYVSDRMGDCPICNMKLVPIKDGADAKPETLRNVSTNAVAKAYKCPHHPDYTFTEPGECPICNMKLVAVDGGGAAGSEGVPGRAMVQISPERQQRIGLKTSVVEVRELTRVIRTTAVVEHDETRLARIAPRFGGWVRKIFVNFTGQDVEKGAPLMTVYSPELFAAENEYLIGWRRVEQLRGAGNSGPDLDQARSILDSARLRLELLEIGDAEIGELEKRGRAGEELLVRAPVSGHVITKTAVEGKSFMAGETLYELAAMNPLWLRAVVYESDLSLVHTGMTARVTLPDLGGQVYPSRVTFLYPHIDPQTRRAEARLEVDNASHALRPGMWANVEIQTTSGREKVVPASAVIDTGDRYVAFVLREDNHVEPRQLKIGVKTDDFWQVLDGLKEGEKVVTRALFLVDSESQLRAAVLGMADIQ